MTEKSKIDRQLEITDFISVTALILTAVIWVIAYWIVRFPINVTSFGFWVFPLLVYTGILFIMEFFVSGNLAMPSKFIVVGILWTVLLLITFVGFDIFTANKSYARLEVKTIDNFEEMVDKVETNSIPRIDKSVAKNLANRELGELENLVSQFEADTDYSTFINYNNNVTRVIPLKYSSFFKWMSNKDTGIPGYIIVDLLEQDAKYVEVEKGIKYAPSACFKYDLKKRIRSKYPTAMLGNYSFELDNEGNPYWIVPELKNEAFNNVAVTENVFVVNAITGNIEKQSIKKADKWIDNALDTELVLEQIDTWGEYKNGFINSLIGQKEVKEATALYNFIIQEDDIYLYTGITSANASDSSNIGFMMVNMRTSEAMYTKCSSVNEKTAKSAAKAIYQEKNYSATDPLLLNVKGIPTYSVSLKAKDGLVKVYAFVNAQDYQQVGYASVDEGFDKALENYIQVLSGELKVSDLSNQQTNSGESTEKSKYKYISQKICKIDVIKEIVIDGTTSYYIVSGNDVMIASIKKNFTLLPNLKVDDEVKITGYIKGDYLEIENISKN